MQFRADTVDKDERSVHCECTKWRDLCPGDPCQRLDQPEALPTELEDLMVIPDDFGVTEDEHIDITVRNTQQVLDVSRQVMEFCTLRGIDDRHAFFAGLCMEEMAGNVVEHGFPKDQKENSIDIRVVHCGEQIILRIRDNCVAFNPSERRKIMEPQETGKNIGIRLVYSIASEVSYQNLLGLNVLTIRI